MSKTVFEQSLATAFFFVTNVPRALNCPCPPLEIDNNTKLHQQQKFINYLDVWLPIVFKDFKSWASFKTPITTASPDSFSGSSPSTGRTWIFGLAYNLKVNHINKKLL